MKYFLNTLAAIVLPLVTVSSVAMATNDQSLQLKTKSLKASNPPSVVHDEYKYVKGTEPHDNYTYYLGIGTFDLNYWVGTTWSVSYNNIHVSSYYRYTHKAGIPPGICAYGESPLEEYFDCHNSYEWKDFKPYVMPYLFPKQFDSDMAAWESIDFSEVLANDPIAHTDLWVKAWQNHDAIIIIYHTWYTSMWHTKGERSYSIQIATPAVYNHYFG